MYYDQAQAFSLHVEPSVAKAEGWAWTIYRDPDRMLIARSCAAFAGRDQALGAGHKVAVTVRCKLELARSQEAAPKWAD